MKPICSEANAIVLGVDVLGLLSAEQVMQTVAAIDAVTTAVVMIAITLFFVFFVFFIFDYSFKFKKFLFCRLAL